MATARSISPPSGGGAGDRSPTGNDSGPTATTKMRKRTKTGCLTCRKRRIKCGEERPTCANCIKSKRQCEGYNQRVVFKPPIGDWPNHPGVVSTIQYHTSMLPGSRNPQYRGAPSTGQTQEQVPASLQPQPSGSFDISGVDEGGAMGQPVTSSILVGGATSYSPEQVYQQPLPSPHHQQPLLSPHHLVQSPTPSASYFPSQQSPTHTTFRAPYNTAALPGYQRYTQQPNHYQQIPASYGGFVDTKLATSQGLHDYTAYAQEYPSPTHSDEFERDEAFSQYTAQQPMMPRYNSHPHIASHNPQLSPIGVNQSNFVYPPVSHANFANPSYPPVQIPSHDLFSDVKYLPQSVLGMSHV
jgi:hypothetical protein